MNAETRIARVLQHFDGRSICPFAQAAVRAPAGIVVVELERLDDDEVLVSQLSTFTPSTAAAIVLAPSDPPSHAEARTLAAQLFGRLALACYQINHPWVIFSRARVLDDIQHAQTDPVRHPLLDLHGSPLFTVAMGPAYPPDHPRYAPHLCAVMTWQFDVVRTTLTHPKVVARIREAMRERTGTVYDAVALYL